MSAIYIKQNFFFFTLRSAIVFVYSNLEILPLAWKIKIETLFALLFLFFNKI